MRQQKIPTPLVTLVVCFVEYCCCCASVQQQAAHKFTAVTVGYPVTVHLGPAYSSSVEAPSRGTVRCEPFLVSADDFAARFTPEEPGIHTLTIQSSPPTSRSFLANYADDDQPTMGFLRVGPNRQHFVDSASNRTIVLRGFNIAWPHPNPGLANVTKYYKQYFEQMQAVGANYARVWLAPNLAHPWNPLALLKTYSAVNLAVADVVDDLLALAQTYGIRLMLVLESFNALCPDGANSECRYNKSVYNERNGGPLPARGGFLTFWSNADANTAWENYLRFAAARFAPHPSLFAFQLFNEVDACMFDVVESAYAWHKRMAKVLHQADQYGHVVSESFGINVGNPIIDADSGFDITTTHAYARVDRGDSPDTGIAAATYTAAKLKAYQKPSFVGEYGCDDDSGQILTEQALHDGVWAPLFAGAAATGAFWYWDSLPVEWWSLNLRAVSAFLAELTFDLGDKIWEPVQPIGLPNTVETVAIVSADQSTLLMFLHSRNGSEPCVRPASQVIPSFELHLPASILIDTFTWYNSSTGLPLRVNIQANRTRTSSDTITVRTPEFVSDVILVGAA
eukprot:COSAG05_NODE_10_length_39559_cov_64.255423_8_plen_566_part_00